MAQLVKTSIDINGKPIKQFSSLNITQGIFQHHTFRLVCPSEAIDSPKAQLFDTSKDYIGNPIKIKMESVGGAAVMNFFGVVTRVEAERFSGHAGNIILSGFSPTILLDTSPDCMMWEKRKLNLIATMVVAGFSSDLIHHKAEINPTFSEEIEYTVQYMETAWQFLFRLATMYGEWFFYDGQKLILGPPKGKQTKLIYDNNMHQFTMSLQARQTDFFTKAHDYINDAEYFSATVNKNNPRSKGYGVDITNKNGLKDLVKFVYDKSQDLFTYDSNQWNNQFLTSKKELDDFVTIRASAHSSNMVHLNGSSDNLEVQVGGSISVEGKNVFMDDTNEPFGDYTVTSVTHECNGEGNYSNFFGAIPAYLKVPPVTTYPEPQCESQCAVVTDNNDTKGLGRIRVRFHWMTEDQKSPWIRVTTTYAGSGKGIFFMPEVGEEVIVGFEGGSAVKPFIIGCVWNGKAKNNSANGGNSLKVIQTKSGNSISFNDGDGSITIKDKNGSSVLLDGDDNVAVQSKKSVKLISVTGNFSPVARSLEIYQNGKITLNGEDVILQGSKKITVMSNAAKYEGNEKGESLISGLTSEIHGDTEVKVTSPAQATVSSDTGNVAVKGMAVDIKGMTVNLNC